MTLPAAFLKRPFAHRGLHDTTKCENSLPAIQAAIDADYGIEIDIQPSRDGTPMVFHDYELKRLTGAVGMVVDKTASELGNIELRGDSGTIPTLRQVLDLVAGRVPLLIEIKDQDGTLGPKVGTLEQAVCSALIGYSGDAALMSFNSYSVAACKKFAPNIPRGLTTCPFAAADWPNVSSHIRRALREISDFDRLEACFISHQVNNLSSPYVTNLKARGVPIFCWTIRSPEIEAEARKIADNITFEGYRA